MVDATQRELREIHSIELDDALSAAAKRRLRTVAHVHRYRGDSGELLPVASRGSRNRACSGCTPPQAILAHPIRGHVVLIDDAGSFTGDDGYPSLGGLRRLVSGRRLEEADGVIRVAPELRGAVPRGGERSGSWREVLA